ncbi:MAG: hypothetical protein MZV65_15845 [Chromatiales bacterium]|nr:hypothetical protein [Chromatiales bacterium]
MQPPQSRGRVWSREELASPGGALRPEELWSWSPTKSTRIIVLPGRRHTCSASISEDAASRSLTCLAVSKTFNLARGLCTANVAIPDRGLREGFLATAAGNLGLGTSNAFGIVAQEAAYSRGEPWLEELIRYVEGNLPTTQGRSGWGVPGIRVFPLEGTYLACGWTAGARACPTRSSRSFLPGQGAGLADEGTKFGAAGSGFHAGSTWPVPRATLEAASGADPGRLLRRSGSSGRDLILLGLSGVSASSVTCGTSRGYDPRAPHSLRRMHVLT